MLESFPTQQNCCQVAFSSSLIVTKGPRSVLNGQLLVGKKMPIFTYRCCLQDTLDSFDHKSLNRQSKVIVRLWSLTQTLSICRAKFLCGHFYTSMIWLMVDRFERKHRGEFYHTIIQPDTRLLYPHESLAKRPQKPCYIIKSSCSRN